jgi:hypothetical protein
MNFLDFRPYAFKISKKNHLTLFELIKHEAALKVWYFVKSVNLTINFQNNK